MCGAHPAQLLSAVAEHLVFLLAGRQRQPRRGPAAQGSPALGLPIGHHYIQGAAIDPIDPVARECRLLLPLRMVSHGSSRSLRKPGATPRWGTSTSVTHLSGALLQVERPPGTATLGRTPGSGAASPAAPAPAAGGRYTPSAHSSSRPEIRAPLGIAGLPVLLALLGPELDRLLASQLPALLEQRWLSAGTPPKVASRLLLQRS